MAFGDCGVVDDFNRADDTSPPPGSSWTTVYNGHDLISNQLVGHTASDDCITQWNTTYNGSLQAFFTMGLSGTPVSWAIYALSTIYDIDAVGDTPSSAYRLEYRKVGDVDWSVVA